MPQGIGTLQFWLSDVSVVSILLSTFIIITTLGSLISLVKNLLIQGKNGLI